MTCSAAQELLYALVDGELDARQREMVTHHVAGCPACAQKQQEAEYLIETLSHRSLSYPAPGTLREQVTALMATSITPTWFSQLISTKAGITVVITVCLALLLGGWAVVSQYLPHNKPLMHTLPFEVLARDAYLRSVKDGKLVQFIGNDAKQLKNWLTAQHLEMPPLVNVPNLPLQGARLEQLGCQAALVLVYGQGDEQTQLFTWPTIPEFSCPPMVTQEGDTHHAVWSVNGERYYLIGKKLGEKQRQLMAGLGGR